MAQAKLKKHADEMAYTSADGRFTVRPYNNGWRVYDKETKRRKSVPGLDEARAYIAEQGGGEVPNEKKNPHAVALGKLGGAKGGKARAEALTPERRSEIARQASLTRWGKYQDKPERGGKTKKG